MKTFNELEAACSAVFESLRPLWHLWTPEDAGIILPDKTSFKAAMTILAICAQLCPDGMKEPPLMLDGYASPMSFCNIDAGEKLFRNATHYFREISRNVEASKRIAAEIGERLYYNDDDLFAVVLRICKEQYKLPSPGMLSSQAKIEVAKQMHFDYNAGNKQIARILKMDRAVVDSLFPLTARTRDQKPSI